jgi:hypothetical protein
MKHLVKFSESIESSEWSDVDVEYFKNCFIDFFDRSDYKKISWRI